MKIEIPDDQITEVFSASILSSLTTETRDQMIQGAIAHLMHKDKKDYGSGHYDSPLESAFKGAIERLARDFAVKELENNQEVKSVMKDYIDKALKLDWDARNDVLQAICNALIEVIVEKRQTQN